MRGLILIIFTFFIISFTGISSVQTAEAKNNSAYSINDENEYTYVHVYSGGKHYIYVYQGDILIDVYEVEE